jgi:hypothetical protein
MCVRLGRVRCRPCDFACDAGIVSAKREAKLEGQALTRAGTRVQARTGSDWLGLVEPLTSWSKRQERGVSRHLLVIPRSHLLVDISDPELIST